MVIFTAVGPLEPGRLASTGAGQAVDFRLGRPGEGGGQGRLSLGELRLPPPAIPSGWRRESSSPEKGSGKCGRVAVPMLGCRACPSSCGDPLLALAGGWFGPPAHRLGGDSFPANGLQAELLLGLAAGAVAENHAKWNSRLTGNVGVCVVEAVGLRWCPVVWSPGVGGAGELVLVGVSGRDAGAPCSARAMAGAVRGSEATQRYDAPWVEQHAPGRRFAGPDRGLVSEGL